MAIWAGICFFFTWHIRSGKCESSTSGSLGTRFSSSFICNLLASRTVASSWAFSTLNISHQTLITSHPYRKRHWNALQKFLILVNVALLNFTNFILHWLYHSLPCVMLYGQKQITSLSVNFDKVLQPSHNYIGTMWKKVREFTMNERQYYKKLK